MRRLFAGFLTQHDFVVDQVELTGAIAAQLRHAQKKRLDEFALPIAPGAPLFVEHRGQ